MPRIWASRLVSTNAPPYEREPVDVVDAEAGVVERGEDRFDREVERRLRQRAPAPVVRRGADADDRGPVLEGAFGHASPITSV